MKVVLQCLAVTKTSDIRPEALMSIYIRGLAMRHPESLSIKYNAHVLNKNNFPNDSRWLSQVTDRGGVVYPKGVVHALCAIRPIKFLLKLNYDILLQ